MKGNSAIDLCLESAPHDLTGRSLKAKRKWVLKTTIQPRPRRPSTQDVACSLAGDDRSPKTRVRINVGASAYPNCRTGLVIRDILNVVIFDMMFCPSAIMRLDISLLFSLNVASASSSMARSGRDCSISVTVGYVL